MTLSNDGKDAILHRVGQGKDILINGDIWTETWSNEENSNMVICKEHLGQRK